MRLVCVAVLSVLLAVAYGVVVGALNLDGAASAHYPLRASVILAIVFGVVIALVQWRFVRLFGVPPTSRSLICLALSCVGAYYAISIGLYLFHGSRGSLAEFLWRDFIGAWVETGAKRCKGADCYVFSPETSIGWFLAGHFAVALTSLVTLLLAMLAMQFCGNCQRYLRRTGYRRFRYDNPEDGRRWEDLKDAIRRHDFTAVWRVADTLTLARKGSVYLEERGCPTCELRYVTTGSHANKGPGHSVDAYSDPSRLLARQIPPRGADIQPVALACPLARRPVIDPKSIAPRVRCLLKENPSQANARTGQRIVVCMLVFWLVMGAVAGVIAFVCPSQPGFVVIVGLVVYVASVLTLMRRKRTRQLALDVSRSEVTLLDMQTNTPLDYARMSEVSTQRGMYSVRGGGHLSLHLTFRPGKTLSFGIGQAGYWWVGDAKTTARLDYLVDTQDWLALVALFGHAEWLQSESNRAQTL